MSRVIPTGSPLWARTVDLAHFGGSTEKANFLDRGPIDALTDVGADQFARFTADAVAMARTVPFCVATLRLTPSGAPFFTYVHMATGVRLVEYVGDEPPTGLPSAVRNGVSDITVTFDGEYADSYGATAPFLIAHAQASVIYTSVCRAVCAVSVDRLSLRVKVFDAANAAITEPADPGPYLCLTLKVY